MTCWKLPRARIVVAVLLLTFASGCGSGRYTVSGRVTYEDGSPVEAGTVLGEATANGKLVGVQGNIEKDGSFTWGADRAGDGALPGNYRVLVLPVALGDAEMAEGKQPAVDGKYTKYETSGLTFEVKPDSNVLNIRVSRPKPRGK